MMRHLWMVCYDIGNQKHRYRVDKLLSAYGTRIQNSVFEIAVSESELAMLRTKITTNLDYGEAVNYYRLCQWCCRCRETLGAAEQSNIKAYHHV